MDVALEGVTKTVAGRPFIYETSLTLEPGVNVLLGPTRAGKTTLLRLLAGLDQPTTGRVQRPGSVAMVYQEFVNYPSLTVYENIASPLRAQRVADDEVDGRVTEIARLLGIDDLLARLPSQLSGGQQQRTAIARALIKNADLILLDEPLANLDYKLRERLRDDLQTLFAENTVVVYATSEPAEALVLGGRTAVVHEGKILQHDQTPAVYARPADEQVARIFGDPPMNIVPASLLAQEQGPPGPSGRVGVRPHHLRFARASPEDVAVPVTVQLAELSGSATRVHARSGDIELISQQQGLHPMDLGEHREFFVDPNRLFVFDDAGALIRWPQSS